MLGVLSRAGSGRRGAVPRGEDQSVWRGLTKEAIRPAGRRLRGERAVFSVCLVLMVAVAFSASGAYARYATSSTLEAQARVARWEVDLVPAAEQGAALTLDGSQDTPQVSYVFSLSNASEVAARATLELELSEPLQSGVEVYVVDAAGQRLGESEGPDGLTYTFDAGTFGACADSSAFSLVFAGTGSGSIAESQDDIEVVLIADFEQVVD